MLNRLWNDETGAVVSAELVVVMTILVVGVITGLSSLRDAVITELADTGAAIGQLDQSYQIAAVTTPGASTAESRYEDQPDYCDDETTTTASRCLVICDGGFVASLEGSESGS
jgi:Flp pilus assembly pilin Flp